MLLAETVKAKCKSMHDYRAVLLAWCLTQRKPSVHLTMITVPFSFYYIGLFNLRTLDPGVHEWASENKQTP